MTAPAPNWGSGRMARIETAHLGGPCRVCGEAIPSRAPAWLVPWRVGKAHEMCGYLTAEENDVHLVRTENDRWWSWRCPTCKLDATSEHKPEEGDPLECRRCFRPELVVGSLVAAANVGRRAIVGKNQRSAFVWPGDRGLVVSVAESGLVVDWARTEKRPAARTRASVAGVRVIR